MPAPGFTLNILAQADNLLYRKQMFDAMHERFVEGEPDIHEGILTAVLILIFLFGGIWLLYRWQQRRHRPASSQPMAFYRRMLGKLGLSLVDRWWLRRLASFSGIEHPTAMLISSRLYDATVERFCAGQGVFLSRAGSAASLAAIRRKLFGGNP